jgi:hypothetical protein
MFNCNETIGCKTSCFIKCHECDNIINYKELSTYKTSIKRSKNFGICSSCLKKGDRNPFFNKKHSKESMKKMVDTSNNSECRKKYYEKIRAKEYREYLSNWMKSNSPMKGNSYYKIWVEKYGVDIADKMNKECSLKKSVKGEKNYWFGKTPPFGSGNGWSGWYNGWYFRSLLELSYMVNVIEKNNLKWVTGESNIFKIEYKHNNVIKNYFPDFIVNDKYMIECKPKKLWKTNLIISKKKAAEEFCEKNGLIYKLREVPKMSDDEIFLLYQKEEIVWVDRYKIKFEDRIIKKSNKIFLQTI